jgi:hypothetical protein
MLKSVHVYLTGGLGNQLFQVAAALSYGQTNDKIVVLDTSLGKPRTTKGKADILHLNLPSDITELSIRASRLTQKAAGFLLRMGINPTNLEKNAWIRFVLQSLGRVIFTFRYRKVISLQISCNVGFSELQPKPNSMILGYFQSYRYLQDPKVQQMFFALSPKESSRKLNALVATALEQKPIFVHVRLSDYLNEKHFGNPGKEYYFNSLSRLNGFARNIWVFSDDLDLAKSRMPIEFNDRYFYVDDSELSPAQLLHLLRYGQDYVVANSSFSWWGAALSFNRDSKIIAPDPWFAGMPEPRELIPPHWHREKAYS